MTLAVEDLRFAYGKREILRGVTFTAPSGSLVAILGANGSGKSTLLRSINRLLRPRSGRVLVDGVAVDGMDAREIARAFGYMPQRQAVAGCTVLEAVALGRKVLAGGRIRADDLAHIEEILRLVHLEDLAMRTTTELSGGELQKVVLARALAQGPKVLLLDEPINHLDPVNRIEVMSLLHAVTRDRSITSLVVTHNLNNALRFADRFILLKEGRLLAEGDAGVVTPASIREVFGIDAEMGEIGGTTVVVPRLHGVRAHRHLDPAGGYREHEHEVDEHVFDHRHEPDEHHPSGQDSTPQRPHQAS